MRLAHYVVEGMSPEELDYKKREIFDSEYEYHAYLRHRQREAYRREESYRQINYDPFRTGIDFGALQGLLPPSPKAPSSHNLLLLLCNTPKPQPKTQTKK